LHLDSNMEKNQSLFFPAQAFVTVICISHLGRARDSRSWGKSESKSRHTAWKISAASSRGRPNLIGTEKIRFLYFSIKADQASWLPFRHSAIRRSSVQERSRAANSGFTESHQRPSLDGKIAVQHST